MKQTIDIDIVDRLRINWTSMTDMGNEERAEAADEIERLRAERDEARREICDKVSAYSPSVTAKQWARERGWDCFKEERNA